MKNTLVTKEHLEELGFKPCCSFWILESKDLVGTITYIEEITPQFEYGEKNLDAERYYCIKLHNRKKQEVRFFTEELYVEDITSVMKILKTT